jgi:hypothetical protein
MNESAPWYPPTGSYVVINTSGLGAAVIRRFTHSWADHAVIVVNDAGGIVEALPGGVRKGHLAEYAGRRQAACTEGTQAQRAQVAVAALEMVGTAYDELDLVDIGLECVGIRWGWLEREVEKRHSLICSQAAARCGLAGGLDWSCGQVDLAEVRSGVPGGRGDDVV